MQIRTKVLIIWNIIITVLLFTLLIVFMLNKFCKNQRHCLASVTSKGAKVSGTKVAYIELSELQKYLLASKLNSDLLRQQKQYQASIDAKKKSFQQRLVAFQSKIEKGGYLSKEKAQQEQEALLKQQQELVNLEQAYASQLNQLQMSNAQTVQDSVVNFLKRNTALKNYDYILNDAGLILGNEQYNITKYVITELNKAYKKNN